MQIIKKSKHFKLSIFGLKVSSVVLIRLLKLQPNSQDECFWDRPSYTSADLTSSPGRLSDGILSL